MEPSVPEHLLAEPTATLARDYFGRLLAGDEAGAVRTVAGARRTGISVATVCSRVISKSMNDVGRLWSTGELSIADEHMASEITASALHALRRESPRGSDRTAIVLCPEGEGHSLGGLALAVVLEADGWTVTRLGASTPPGGVVRVAAAQRPDLVAVSVKLEWHRPAALTAISALRELPRPPLLLLGGSAVRAWTPPDTGTLVTDDCDEALAWLRASGGRGVT